MLSNRKKHFMHVSKDRSYDFNRKLVQIIERYPCLYDYTTIDYCCRLKVNKAWESVANEMGDSASNCKEIWRNLRTVYARNCKKYSDPSMEHLFKRYYLIDQMEFVKPFIRTKSFSDTPTNSKNVIESPTSNSLNNSNDQEYFNYEMLENNKNLKSKLEANLISANGIHEEYDDDGSDDGSLRDFTSISKQIKLEYVVSDDDDDPQRFIQDNTKTGLDTNLMVEKNARIGEIKCSDVEQINELYCSNTNNQTKQNTNTELVSTVKTITTCKCQHENKGPVVTDTARQQFLGSLLPDIEKMNDLQMRKFRVGVSVLIDDIFSKDENSENK